LATVEEIPAPSLRGLKEPRDILFLLGSPGFFVGPVEGRWKNFIICPAKKRIQKKGKTICISFLPIGGLKKRNQIILVKRGKNSEERFLKGGGVMPI